MICIFKQVQLHGSTYREDMYRDLSHQAKQHIERICNENHVYIKGVCKKRRDSPTNDQFYQDPYQPETRLFLTTCVYAIKREI